MIPANKVTETKDKEMAMEVRILPFQTQVTKSNNPPSNEPLSRESITSLSNR